MLHQLNDVRPGPGARHHLHPVRVLQQPHGLTIHVLVHDPPQPLTHEDVLLVLGAQTLREVTVQLHGRPRGRRGGAGAAGPGHPRGPVARVESHGWAVHWRARGVSRCHETKERGVANEGPWAWLPVSQTETIRCRRTLRTAHQANGRPPQSASPALLRERERQRERGGGDQWSVLIH